MAKPLRESKTWPSIFARDGPPEITKPSCLGSANQVCGAPAESAPAAWAEQPRGGSAASNPSAVSYSPHMAPTIFRDGQFRLFFFSREETRIHVHVAPGRRSKVLAYAIGTLG